jgi:hypothetical protein
MKRLIFLSMLAAAPAFGQVTDRQLPSETACQAVLERVQIALSQADAGLQSEDQDAVARWSGIAASYAQVYAAFCKEIGE